MGTESSGYSALTNKDKYDIMKHMNNIELSGRKRPVALTLALAAGTLSLVGCTNPETEEPSREIHRATLATCGVSELDGGGADEQRMAAAQAVRSAVVDSAGMLAELSGASPATLAEKAENMPTERAVDDALDAMQGSIAEQPFVPGQSYQLTVCGDAFVDATSNLTFQVVSAEAGPVYSDE